MGNGNILGTVNIERGIFQGDSLSPLLFVMIPLSMRLKSTELGFNLRNESRSIRSSVAERFDDGEGDEREGEERVL